ncbi:MAG: hypothetical protein PHQ34_12855 [Methanothrix sp.]|nr:hypothetical protein [Methanothrix sp.]
MSAQKRKNELLVISQRVMRDLERHLQAMEKAAEQISSGQELETIDDAGYHIYLARKDPKDCGSRAEAVLSTMNYDEFYRLLEKAAGEFGLCLEVETKMEVVLPEAEFEENMITGGFEKFKGLAVEHHNECLEELMVAVCFRLKERGFAVACVPDEDVIFYLPLDQ